MQLSSKQRRYLKSLAHHLNPLVQVGKQGYSAQMRDEIDRHLKDHELIKVRVAADERSDFESLASQMATETQAALVATIGRITLLYRPSDEPQIRLP